MANNNLANTTTPPNGNWYYTAGPLAPMQNNQGIFQNPALAPVQNNYQGISQNPAYGQPPTSSVPSGRVGQSNLAIPSEAANHPPASTIQVPGQDINAILHQAGPTPADGPRQQICGACLTQIVNSYL